MPKFLSMAVPAHPNPFVLNVCPLYYFYAFLIEYYELGYTLYRKTENRGNCSISAER
jgi:hypothetical protein